MKAHRLQLFSRTYVYNLLTNMTTRDIPFGRYGTNSRQLWRKDVTCASCGTALLTAMKGPHPEGTNLVAAAKPLLDQGSAR